MYHKCNSHMASKPDCRDSYWRAELPTTWQHFEQFWQPDSANATVTWHPNATSVIAIWEPCLTARFKYYLIAFWTIVTAIWYPDSPLMWQPYSSNVTVISYANDIICKCDIHNRYMPAMFDRQIPLPHDSISANCDSHITARFDKHVTARVHKYGSHVTSKALCARHRGRRM